MLDWRITAHPTLIQLVKQCLHNVPDQRPSTDELLATLQRMKVEVEGKYGSSLDMVRMRLAKEIHNCHTYVCIMYIRTCGCHR